MEKFKKGLKIFIIIDLILLTIIVLLSIFNNDLSNKNKPIKSNDCIYKGQVCTLEEMYEGVEVKVEVKKDTFYVFNVIANSTETLTLLMNENLKDKVNWHGELINLKGPQTAFNHLLSETEGWNKLNNIESYQYEDFGRKNFENTCLENNVHEDYDCSTETYTTRGYGGISIENGTLTLNFNLPQTVDGVIPNQQYSYPEYQAKVRMITYEEVDEFLNGTKYPKWLISNLKKNKGFWTMSSSTSKKTGYQQGAIAIVNVDNKVSIESIYPMHENQSEFEVGIRPVIEINKPTKK